MKEVGMLALPMGRSPWLLESLCQFSTLLPCIPAPTEKGWHYPDGPAKIYTRRKTVEAWRIKRDSLSSLGGSCPYSSLELELGIANSSCNAYEMLLTEGPEQGQSPLVLICKVGRGLEFSQLPKQVLNKWQILLLKLSLRPECFIFIPIISRGVHWVCFLGQIISSLWLVPECLIMQT